jgi:hypothetical protein
MIMQMAGNLMRRNHWAAKIKPPWCYSDINMTIMKTENNVTQNRQNKDLEAPFSPREFLKIKRVCKIFLLWKRNLYIRSLVSCVTKLVGVYSFRNDNGENKKFDNPY